MIFRFAIVVALAASVGGCMSSSLSEVKDSVSGGLKRDGDTYGTNRRADVYGEFTRPSLPTVGAPGYGK